LICFKISNQTNIIQNKITVLSTITLGFPSQFKVRIAMYIVLCWWVLQDVVGCVMVSILVEIKESLWRSGRRNFFNSPEKDWNKGTPQRAEPQFERTLFRGCLRPVHHRKGGRLFPSRINVSAPFGAPRLLVTVLSTNQAINPKNCDL